MAVRIAHTEGSIIRDAAGLYKYEYALRDHLGNTRVTFRDKQEDGIVDATDITQINHYYPFGLNMEGNWNGAAGENKYQFGDKELNSDFGLEWNDYGARWYQPDGGRWLSVDPMTESQESYSPYHYAFDNPIKNNDPDGREPNDIVLRGANNSSVTLKTDLININVDASSLGVNFGGNYTISGDDILQAGLDIVGIVDPTGAADVVNAGISAKKGNWGDAILSSISVLPLGDIVKLGKVEKNLKILTNAIEGAAREVKELKALKEANLGATVLTQKTLRTADGKKAIDAVTETGRRVDNVVIKEGKVTHVGEVTSQKASKTAQLEKEKRIRENGGTYIRHKKQLYDIKDVPTTLTRRD